MFRRYDIIRLLKKDPVLANVLRTPRKFYDFAFILLKDYLSLIEKGRDPLQNRELFIEALTSRIVSYISRADIKIEPDKLKKLASRLLDEMKEIEKIELKKLALYYGLCKYGRRLVSLLNAARLPLCQS